MAYLQNQKSSEIISGAIPFLALKISVASN